MMADLNETTAPLDGRLDRWLGRYEERLARGDLGRTKAEGLLEKMKSIALLVINGEITVDKDGYFYRSAVIFGHAMVVGIPPEVDRGTAEMVKDLAEIIEQDTKDEGQQDE
ncbi:MAG: hypothetical protein HY814_03850 [Candidatus Riflebacteria bacterium]|nr:hypothetical protein [Candidatus Riflebacteria bacterium]